MPVRSQWCGRRSRKAELAGSIPVTGSRVWVDALPEKVHPYAAVAKWYGTLLVRARFRVRSPTAALQR